jgi:hypothetical protein
VAAYKRIRFIMKDKVLNKIAEYLDNNALEDISDRRFASILQLASECIKLEKKTAVKPDGKDAQKNNEIMDFLTAVEKSTSKAKRSRTRKDPTPKVEE